MPRPELEAIFREHAVSTAAAEAIARLWEHERHATVTSSIPLGPALPTRQGSAQTADRYEDLGLLGKGGHGEVRRVRDRVLARVLALKVLHPALAGDPRTLARFLDEARVGAQLRHPGRGHRPPVDAASVGAPPAGLDFGPPRRARWTCRR